MYREFIYLENKQKLTSTTIEFSKEELITYFNSIKNNTDITNRYKLKIANTIINEF